MIVMIFTIYTLTYEWKKSMMIRTFDLNLNNIICPVLVTEVFIYFEKPQTLKNRSAIFLSI